MGDLWFQTRLFRTSTSFRRMKDPGTNLEEDNRSIDMKTNFRDVLCHKSNQPGWMPAMYFAIGKRPGEARMGT